jgi:hypothetical protein
VSALDRAIAELLKQEALHASQSLTRPAGKRAFDYGHSCGLYQGLLIARSILERCLNESDPNKTERDDKH